MPNIQLANNLRYLRKLNNMTQDDLSAALNISRQAYSNYENSKRTPDLDSLRRLSGIFHVSLDKLVNENLASPSQLIKETSEPYYMAIDTQTGNTLYLTEAETKLISGYRSLSEDNRCILNGFIKANT